MIYQLKVKMEGNTYIKKPYKMKVGNYLVSVENDKKNYVTFLTIGRRIKDYKEYLPKITVKEDSTPHIHIPVVPYYDDIIDLIKHIESLGSFWFQIKKIYWGEPEIIWVPENKEEAKLIHDSSANNIKFTQQYDTAPLEMRPDILKEIIEKRDMYEHLIIPLSFYREGRNEFELKRYINAYYNFYFYLEDLYGNGKTKNYQIRREFLKSNQFKEAVSKTLEEFKNDPSKKHYKNLKTFLKLESCSYDIEGVISLIVKVRGNLHHFSQKSSKKLGHPFNQKDFETMAFLLMSICVKTYTRLTTGEKPC